MLKFASLFTLAAILSATASGQCKGGSSDAVVGEGGGSGIFMDKRSPEERAENEIVAEGGGNGIFMDKRSPEERAESEVVASGGGNGIFMDKQSPEERCETEGSFMQSGGDTKIFKGEDPGTANEFAQSGGNPKILKDPDSADTRDGSF